MGPSLVLLLFAFALLARSSDEKAAVDAAQSLFDAMAAHDAAAIRRVLLPDARFYAVRDDRLPTSTAGEAFASQIGAATGGIVERFTSPPRVLIHGRIAQVWGEYVFLRDGKLNHCGVDSFSLLKTSEGWKIAAIEYTAETTGCKAP
ncbi:MAG TPA: nuclear transport factor 2 family protein [Bryobacteraceae bacterium]|jgi:hypothetical protein|nr:nuclear transport factor 2 family protein [Bryobacteraceae bacterium]